MQRKLSWSSIIGYGLGDVANNFAFAMGALFLLNYYTDIAGIPAAAAGTMLLAIRVFDAFADIAAGRVVDRTNSRWGRFRPYLLWSSIPLMGMSVLVFSVPAGWGPGAKLLYAYLTYAGLGLAYSFINIPYGSLATVMTQDAGDRSRLGASRTLLASATFAFLALVLGPRIRAAHDLQSVFTHTTAALAVAGLGLYLLCFRATAETVHRRSPRTPLAESLRTLARNTPLLLLCATSLCMLVAVFSMNASSLFFARYVLGDAGLFIPIVIINVLLGTLVAAPLVPFLVGRLGKKATFIAGAALAAAGYLVLFAATPAPAFLLLPILAIAAIGAMVCMTVIWALEADTVEYGEWATGLRVEGLTYAFFSFTRKCGQALGGSVPAYLLAASGYVPNLAAQSADARWGITAAMCLVPAGGFALAALLMALYPLTETRFAALLHDIRAKAA
jgi:glucuronide carrier protein